jgi:hypothetical protein
LFLDFPPWVCIRLFRSRNLPIGIVEAVDEAADSGKKATGLQGTEIRPGRRDVARMAKIC